jgi:hypothetical protein
MANWENFTTVKEWIKDSPEGVECAKSCHKCQKTFASMNAEGRGEESIHMVDAVKIGPCGLPFNFECDQCYQKINQ